MEANAIDARDLFVVLESELKFFENGGYESFASTAWKPLLYFEASPCCPNLNEAAHPYACTDCVLIKLVPLSHRNDPVPCRHIPLNHLGITLDNLYRWGSLDEMRTIYGRWLRRTIPNL